MSRFLRSISYALRGIHFTFKTERNFRIHTVALCLAIMLGTYLSLPLVKWCLIIFSIGFVLVAELFNTALERLGDEVAGRQPNQLVGKAKDASAAAVLLAAFTALAVGTFILLVPLVQRALALF